MKYQLNVLLFLFTTTAMAQDDFFGKWKTIDDQTGKPKSVVEIYEKDGQYYGQVIKLFREEGENPDPICTKCEGERKGEKIIGMEILSHMKYDKGNNEFKKGEILDPKNGNVYDCKIWIEDGELQVRGYLLFFYRTQTWLSYND